MDLDWGTIGTSTLAGAGSGAALGPWGAVGGGALGLILGLLGGPTKDKYNKMATGTPGQEQLHNDILSQAMGMSQGGGYQKAQGYYNRFLGPNNQQAYDQFSAPYLQQFQDQVLPGIAERFAGAGALSSSGFGQALGGAAGGLQSQLAQLFSSLQGQAAQQQYGQYNQLVGTGLGYQPFAYEHVPGSAGIAGPFAANMLQGDAGSKRISDLLKLFIKE